MAGYSVRPEPKQWIHNGGDDPAWLPAYTLKSNITWITCRTRTIKLWLSAGKVSQIPFPKPESINDPSYIVCCHLSDIISRPLSAFVPTTGEELSRTTTVMDSLRKSCCLELRPCWVLPLIEHTRTWMRHHWHPDLSAGSIVKYSALI